MQEYVFGRKTRLTGLGHDGADYIAATKRRLGNSTVEFGLWRLRGGLAEDIASPVFRDNRGRRDGAVRIQACPIGCCVAGIWSMESLPERLLSPRRVHCRSGVVTEVSGCRDGDTHMLSARAAKYVALSLQHIALAVADTGVGDCGVIGDLLIMARRRVMVSHLSGTGTNRLVVASLEGGAEKTFCIPGKGATSHPALAADGLTVAVCQINRVLVFDLDA